MTRFIKKISIILLTLTVFVSVFVCAQVAFADSFAPWNVSFVVTYNGDSFRYDLQSQLQDITDADSRGFYLSARGKLQLYRQLLSMGLDNNAVCEYLLPNFGKVISHFYYVNADKVDATVTFGKDGFVYHGGQDGVAIDVADLFCKALTSQGKTVKISLPLVVDKAVTVNQLKSVTVVKSVFSTSYANSGENRCHNVAQATNSLNGTIVGVGEKFSFNKVVGNRTEENGYLISKVILDGQYTDGLGGGVCQVSTTLYNALLLAGFIPKATQHTLVSSYVLAGFDAMVSYGTADLTFVNDTAHPIYIKGQTSNKTVTFTVYGQPNDYRIVRENQEEREPFATRYIVDRQKYPQLVYDDQMQIVNNGSDGVKTKSFLCYYKDGDLVMRKQIRANSYKRVDKVIAHGYKQRPQDCADE